MEEVERKNERCVLGRPGSYFPVHNSAFLLCPAVDAHRQANIESFDLVFVIDVAFTSAQHSFRRETFVSVSTCPCDLASSLLLVLEQPFLAS
jgi:hypothetical protein